MTIQKLLLTKPIYFFVIICTLFLNVSLSSANPQLAEIYISPQGNDSWSGLVASKNTNATDGPVRTLERARDIVRRVKQGKPNASIVVNLREGVYFRDKSFVLTSEDSGTVSAPVIWQNYRDEEVSIVGGTSIDGFTQVTDESNLNRLSLKAKSKVVQLNLKSVGITDYGQITKRGNPGLELFFDNKRMTLARWPNDGWAKITDVPQTGKVVHKGNLNLPHDGLPTGKHFGRFSFSDPRVLTWTNTEDIILHGYWVWDWYDEFLHVESIDKTNQEIHIAKPHSVYGLRKNQSFYALNVLEELDLPGEWYLDRKTGIIYFWPPGSLAHSNITVSLLNEPLIVVDETQYIAINGLTFEVSRGSAIEINGGAHNHIGGCTVRNVGETAIKINGGIDNGITSCDIYDISSSGISLDGGDRKSLTEAGNYAINNHIYNYSSWVRTYQPAIDISGVGNRIAYNEIHDAPHSGIILTGNEHVIEYNDIHHVAKETQDVGAFYMGRDWTQRGNIIRNNYFHDLGSSEKNQVNAVYLDDFSSGTEIYDNIFYNTGRGVKIGGGRDNTVEGNVFIDTYPSIRVDSRGQGWAKYFVDGRNKTLFERMDAMNYTKPPFSEKYPELVKLYRDEPEMAKNNHILNNISSSDKWLNLLNGLDLSIVNVHDNIVFQKGNSYKNEKDIVLSESDFISILDNEIKINAGFIKKYHIKLPDLKRIGNYEDTFRK